MGWVGFMTFGMLYWLAPRMFQAPLWSKKLMNAHFWIATIGILLYIVPIYVAGLTQGLMWRALDAQGRAALRLHRNRDGVDADVLDPRGGRHALFARGGAMRRQPAEDLGGPAGEVRGGRPRGPGPARSYVEPPLPESRLKGAAVIEFAHWLDVWLQGWWHRRGERRPLRFTIWVVCSIVAASLFEIIPLFLIKSNIPTIKEVKPYTPLELLGRDIYIENGCYNCHSQMVRPDPGRDQALRRIQQAGRVRLRPSVPVGLAADRAGHRPARAASNRPIWHVRHFRDPRETSQGKSIMPTYDWLLDAKAEIDAIPQRMRGMQMLGVPYTDEDIAGSIEAAHKQAAAIVAKIKDQRSMKARRNWPTSR